MEGAVSLEEELLLLQESLLLLEVDLSTSSMTAFSLSLRSALSFLPFKCLSMLSNCRSLFMSVTISISALNLSSTLSKSFYLLMQGVFHGPFSFFEEHELMILKNGLTKQLIIGSTIIKKVEMLIFWYLFSIFFKVAPSLFYYLVYSFCNFWFL